MVVAAVEGIPKAATSDSLLSQRCSNYCFLKCTKWGSATPLHSPNGLRRHLPEPLVLVEVHTSPTLLWLEGPQQGQSLNPVLTGIPVKTVSEAFHKYATGSIGNHRGPNMCSKLSLLHTLFGYIPIVPYWQRHLSMATGLAGHTGSSHPCVTMSLATLSGR